MTIISGFLVLASILSQQYVRAGKQIIDQHEDVDNVKYCGMLKKKSEKKQKNIKGPFACFLR